MRRLQLGAVNTILAIGAHADDIEIGCGGTLLRLLREHDVEVHWVVLSGLAGRREEAQHGAESFLESASAKRVRIHDFRDAYFPAQFEGLKDLLHEIAAEVAPDLVFTHRRDDPHQDHRLVSELTWNAFRDHLVLEYEVPGYEGDLGNANVYVPLSEACCERKIELLMNAYPSQKEKGWFTPDTFWSMLRLRGVEADADARFAEAFRGRKIIL